MSRHKSVPFGIFFCVRLFAEFKPIIKHNEELYRKDGRNMNLAFGRFVLQFLKREMFTQSYAEANRGDTQRREQRHFLLNSP
jgi:hypothetical protein